MRLVGNERFEKQQRTVKLLKPKTFQLPA